jgi:hypothetical protein
MNYVKLEKTIDGCFILETDAPCGTSLRNGKIVTFFPINLSQVSSPMLEDLFHEINAELMFRDKRFVDETF